MSDQEWPPGTLEAACPECLTDGPHPVVDDAGRTLLVCCSACGEEFEVQVR